MFREALSKEIIKERLITLMMVALDLIRLLLFGEIVPFHLEEQLRHFGKVLDKVEL